MTPEEYRERAAAMLRDTYTDAGVYLWLTRPNKLLGGERATDLIERGEGERVLAIIEAIETGGL